MGPKEDAAALQHLPKRLSDGRAGRRHGKRLWSVDRHLARTPPAAKERLQEEGSLVGRCRATVGVPRTAMATEPPAPATRSASGLSRRLSRSRRSSSTRRIRVAGSGHLAAGEAVTGASALALSLDHAHRPQGREVLGEVGRGDARQGSQLSRRAFSLAEQVNDLEPDGVTHRPAHLGIGASVICPGRSRSHPPPAPAAPLPGSLAARTACRP